MPGSKKCCSLLFTTDNKALCSMSKESILKSGFINLKTEHDLLEKLIHDFERLESDPDDTYIAFDLFVTASHIADWLKKGDGKAAKDFRKQHVILKVCNHLACGGKHFSLNDSQHNSIVTAKKTKYVEDGYVKKGYLEEPLEIELDENQARALGVDNPVSAIRLAKLAVVFWRSQLGT